MSFAKTTVFFSFCLVMMGCGSSKPEIDDVKQIIVDGWGTCPVVKPIDFKKENGLQQGSNYKMAVSYSLEFQMDTPLKGFKCKPDNLYNTVFLLSLNQLGKKDSDVVNKGERLQLAPVFNMAKSENGWIVMSTE